MIAKLSRPRFVLSTQPSALADNTNLGLDNSQRHPIIVNYDIMRSSTDSDLLLFSSDVSFFIRSAQNT